MRGTLLLLPALQKWQLGFWSFYIILSRICPSCACTQLFLVSLYLVSLYLVSHSFFVPVANITEDMFVQVQALQQWVPGPRSQSVSIPLHGGLLAHRMKFNLHCVAGRQGFHPGAAASPAPLVILITPCSPDPKSSTSPTSQACRSPTDCLLSSLSLRRPPRHARLKPSPASLCWMLPRLTRTQAGRS